MQINEREQAARDFHRDGYVVMRQAYRGEILTAMRAAALRVQQRALADQLSGIRYWWGGSVKRSAVPSQHDANACSWGVNEITRPELFEPCLIDCLGNTSIDGFLSTVLDQPRAWGLKLLWAPQAVAYNLHWHRDISNQLDGCLGFKPVANDHVQFNAALEPDTAFTVIPRSHRRAADPDEWEHLHRGSTAALPGAVEVCLEPGDVLFMDAHAIHRGRAEAGAPRLSLHFSCQAQWVPLRPWGDPDHFAWICSDAFISRLSPATQAYYRRLAEARVVDDQYDWLMAAASANGWDGTWRARPEGAPTARAAMAYQR